MLNFLQMVYSLQHKHTQGALAYSQPITSLLHLQWLYDNTGAYLQSCKLGPLDDSSSQPAGEGVWVSPSRFDLLPRAGLLLHRSAAEARG